MSAAKDPSPRRVVIIGAAGRDFHNFNVVFRDDPSYEVVAFTAAQIPDIAGRSYPPELAGPHHPEGIPIVDEAELGDLIERESVDVAVFAYSDISYDTVGSLSSIVNAAGADFWLLGANATMLTSSRPVISICSVRTGVGKSQTTRHVAEILQRTGRRVVSVRHPMPYGDLAAQACQRFASYEDLDRHDCTIEEREEYEPHIDHGFVIYAGVDYAQILAAAEEEADVILWDGGNNDLPFFRPDLHIVLADPLRSGHERRYHPGETNVRMADVVVINKCDSADPDDVAEVEASVRDLAPGATVLRADSRVSVDDPSMVEGRDVIVVEDGPTLTHGGMSFGAGVVGAREAGARSIVDPAPFAVGSIAETYRRYSNAVGVLPAMGYGEAQIRDLEATIEATPGDVVVSGTPTDISRVLTSTKPLTRVRYDLVEHEPGRIEDAVRRLLG